MLFLLSCTSVILLLNHSTNLYSLYSTVHRWLALILHTTSTLKQDSWQNSTLDRFHHPKPGWEWGSWKKMFKKQLFRFLLLDKPSAPSAVSSDDSVGCHGREVPLGGLEGLLFSQGQWMLNTTVSGLPDRDRSRCRCCKPPGTIKTGEVQLIPNNFDPWRYPKRSDELLRL